MRPAGTQRENCENEPTGNLSGLRRLLDNAMQVDFEQAVKLWDPVAAFLLGEFGGN